MLSRRPRRSRTRLEAVRGEGLSEVRGKAGRLVRHYDIILFNFMGKGLTVFGCWSLEGGDCFVVLDWVLV